MSSFIDPIAFSVGRANAFVEYLDRSQRYIFVGDHRPSTNTTLAQLSEASSNTFYEPWQQMLYGKAITKYSLGIPNYPYQYGVTYDQWDDQVDPTTQTWYAIVNTGSYSHVFGCLDNANGSPSTIQPDFSTATTSDDFIYRTSDGYKWMYLATTDSATVANLATVNYFPLQVNSAVSSAATPGSIDEIVIVDGGKGYGNYSTGTFQSSDIRIGASSTLYQMSNSSISTANGFYQGCVLMITSGTGVGQFATINQYYTTTEGNYANLSSPFSVTPTNGSGWEIQPGVRVTSDGSQTVNVVARGLVNAASSNSIWRVEVLQRGAGFLSPITTQVVANTVVGVSRQANVRAILPPRGGHGSDVANELGATTVLVGTTLSNTEGGLIPATNQYRQVGIVNNPSFANVQLTLTGSIIPFSNGEPLDVMTLKWGAANAVTNVQSVVVSCDTRLFAANSQVFIQTGAGQLLANVASITNSTSMNLTSNATFTSNTAEVYLANVVSRGYVNETQTSSVIWVTNVNSNLKVGTTVYGEVSGGSGVVANTVRNQVSKDESTFVQLTGLYLSGLGGTFVQNEIVNQGNVTALVHSYSNSVLYVSNKTGQFRAFGNNLIGNTSGAVAQIQKIYAPELVVGSGQIEYFENLETVNPSSNTAESFVVTYRF